MRVAIARLGTRSVTYVAGCDVAIRGDHLCAAVLVFRLKGLELVDAASAIERTGFPYVPGLLSFREIPVLLAAFTRLRIRPEAVLCDGQGVAHPRRFGLASHLGVLLDLPTVGCAKSRLIGEHEPPGQRRGDWSPLVDRGERIGAVLRTRDGVRPLYVSVGHRTTLSDAVRLTLACGAGFRLPEPTRQADQEVGRMTRGPAARGPAPGPILRENRA